MVEGRLLAWGRATLGLAGHSLMKPWLVGVPGEASVGALWVGHSW